MSRLQGLGKQLVAAGLIGTAGFGAGFATGRVGSHSDAVVRAVQAVASAPTHDTPSVTPAPVLAATPRAEEVAAAAEPPSPRRLGEATTSGSATSPRGGDARMISEEAEALSRVGQALRAGQPEVARQLLDDLDARVPRTALGEERSAARLMVRCRSGDPGARVVAQAWLEHHARSVYAPRVRASCDTDAREDGLGDREKR